MSDTKTVFVSDDPEVLAWFETLNAGDAELHERLRQFVRDHCTQSYIDNLGKVGSRLPIRGGRALGWGWGWSVADVDRYALADKKHWVKKDWTHPRKDAPPELIEQWNALRLNGGTCPGMPAYVGRSTPGLRMVGGSVWVTWGAMAPEGVGPQWRKARLSEFHRAIEDEEDAREAGQ